MKIVEFFDDPVALIALIFVRDQAENFQNSILQLEVDSICAIDAVNTIDALKISIAARLENKYFSLDFRAASEKRYSLRKQKLMESFMEFHRTTLKYLNA